MLDTFIAFLELINSAIPNLRSDRKTRVGKALARLYVRLLAIIKTAEVIISLMGKYDFEDVYEEDDPEITRLRTLLLSQERQVRGLRLSLSKSSIETMLSIKAPELHPIMVQMLREKGQILVFYLNTIDPSDPNCVEPDDDFASEILAPSKLMGEDDMVRFLPKSEIRLARSNLKTLKAQAERLRLFLVREFSIEQLA